MSGTLQKVTAFVLRACPDGERELLVMRHPTAGVQVPAGTVDVGEPLPQAAARELAEETGMHDARLVAHLGSESFDTESKRAWPMFRATPLRKGPRADAALLETELPRGYWCNVIGRAGEWAEVVYEEHDLNANPPRVIERYSGWVESDAIAGTVERHFFHFDAPAVTRERWVQHAEQRFECYWVPLRPKPALLPAQQGWLDAVYAKLLAAPSLDARLVKSLVSVAAAAAAHHHMLAASKNASSSGSPTMTCGRYPAVTLSPLK